MCPSSFRQIKMLFETWWCLELKALRFYCKFIFGTGLKQFIEFKFKKSLNECSARLSRMRLKLQKYDVEMKYKLGKELLFADVLSCHFFVESSNGREKDVQALVSLLIESLEIRKKTHNDKEIWQRGFFCFNEKIWNFQSRFDKLRWLISLINLKGKNSARGSGNYEPDYPVGCNMK